MPIAGRRGGRYRLVYSWPFPSMETHVKLVMTLLARDEADIVDANIAYHLAQGVDFIIATDHLSVDGTSDIMRDYERQGALRYIREEGVYSQRVWVTRMARIASVDYGASWVINNDADEFWWPVHGNLKETFRNISFWKNIAVAKRHNFVPVDDEAQPFYRHMLWRQERPVNSIGRPLLPKVAHRGSARVAVAHGNHSIAGVGWQRAVHGAVEVLHFPVRSYGQLRRKVEHLGEGHHLNPSTPELIKSAQSQVYRRHKQNPDFLHHHYQQWTHASAEKAGNGAPASVTRDVRLARFLETLSGIRCDGQQLAPH